MSDRRQYNRRIVTAYICPPIPDGGWDWMAHIEGEEEGPTGYGPTESQALLDLAEQLAELQGETA